MTPRSASEFRSAFLATVAWAVALFCLVAALIGYLLYSSYQRYLTNASEVTQSLSLGLETFLQSHFQAIDLALQAAVGEHQRLRAAPRFDAEGFSRFVSSLRQRVPDAVSVRATDRNGRVIYGDGVLPNNIQNAKDREFFLRARTQNQLVFGTPVVSRITGDYLFPILHPLREANGEFDGVAIVNTAVSRLADVFGSVSLGDHGSITLVDAQMRLLVRFPLPEDFGKGAPITLSGQLTRQAIASGQRQASFRSVSRLDGFHRTLTMRQVGRYPVYILVGMADADVLSPWYRELGIGMGFLVLLGILTAAFCRNIHYRWRVELQLNAMQAVQETHDRLQAVMAAIPDSLVEVDRQGNCLSVVGGRGVGLLEPVGSGGRNLHELLAPPVATAVQSALEEAVTKGAAYGTQVEVQRPAGSRWFELSVARKGEAEDAEGSLIVLSRDITERKLAQAQVEELAYSDLLTHLPNRRMFMDRLRQSMGASQRSGLFCALLFLDLDRFKAVNDTLGHQYGDLLLVQTAQRLRAVLREEDSVARLGGDEFVVILEQLSDSSDEAANQAMHVASKIVQALEGEYRLDNYPFNSSVSLGLTLFCGHEHSVEELLKRADTAMYQAKAAGRNVVRFFDPVTQAGIEARAALEHDLRRAVVNEEFILLYQPQVNAEGHCIGAEALIRWHSPNRGFVSPGDFIPLAEDCGLISPIGHWVMAEACRQLVDWGGKPATAGLTLAVNVSARQFAHPTFVSEVRELLSYYGVEAHRLKLELTESLLITRLDDAIERMQELNAMGIRFALDDFGTGFSSLAYLKRLPLEQIKIDRSFTDAILSDSYDNAICKAIVALSQTLELDVIAEGIETPEQWDYLRASGCHMGQGYLFGRPMSVADFEHWLGARDPQREAATS